MVAQGSCPCNSLAGGFLGLFVPERAREQGLPVALGLGALPRDDEMGDAQDAQGSPFGYGGGSLQELAEGVSSLSDVVESRVDVRANHEVNGQSVEEAFDAATRVNAHVMAETVSDEVRSVVDQREQAEHEAVADEKAVGLERIHPIRGEDHDGTTGARTAKRFQNRFAIIGYVLDHFVQQHDVESVVSEGQVLGLSERSSGQVLGRLPYPGLFHVHSEHVGREVAELAHPGTDAAADVQDPATVQ